MSAPRTSLAAAWRERLARLSPKHRQYAMLTVILVGGFTFLWLILAVGETNQPPRPARPDAQTPTRVTGVGVMAPGQQVNPVDEWVGTAGSKLAQYETERDEQSRLNRDRQSFEAQTLKRFAELEQRLTSNPGGVASTPPLPAPPASPTSPVAAPAPAPAPAAPMPPARVPPGAAAPPLPPPQRYPGPMAMPPGAPPGPLGSDPSLGAFPAMPPSPTIVRVTVSDRQATRSAPGTADEPAHARRPDEAASRHVASFLPVSFTRGTLLGGLDAPTGGQAQSNPHPVLIRLADSSVLPNQFRGDYRECFVIAAGYGDISSERAYLRTESLSCVRTDGSALEIKIQGSVYGEDGKVGMRGRLVTKQGQMLANALLAGVVGGIGQGISGASTSYSSSALGTIANVSGTDVYRAGLGTGVGRALDRLAQYYIKLAENTFPVIEIDAGREIDVVITRGVRLDVPTPTSDASAAGPRQRQAYPREIPNDDQY
jgi:conjugal transfer pilus assembly protein TraB